MPENAPTTLIEAARHYLDTLPDEDRIASQVEVQRFVRWCGADRPCDQLRGQEVANYGETLTGSVTDASRRAEAVRRFLAFAKKARHTPTNLGSHLRLRKAPAARAVRRGVAPKKVELSQEERDALAAELESLVAQRPKIVRDIQRAREDKDFRENAPLSAAREQQAYIEGRIQKLEATLEQAVVVRAGPPPSGGTVDIGSTVLLRNLESDAETTYTLVRPGEVNAARGRISFESPVGRALLKRRVGDEVEVAAPSGTLRLRIEQIEA